MLSILRNKQPFFFIMSAWLILIFNGVIYFNRSEVTEIGFIFFKLIGAPKILIYLILFIIVFYTGYLINSIVNRSVLFEKSYYISGLLYVVLVTSFGDIISYLLPLIGNLFLVLSFKNLLQIFRSKSCKKQVFNASFFILFSSFFLFLQSIYSSTSLDCVVHYSSFCMERVPDANHCIINFICICNSFWYTQ